MNYFNIIVNNKIQTDKIKKDKGGKPSLHIGYNNGLYLNEDVHKEKKWTVKKIKNRGDKLIDEAVRLYSWPDLIEEKSDVNEDK